MQETPGLVWGSGQKARAQVWSRGAAALSGSSCGASLPLLRESFWRGHHFQWKLPVGKKLRDTNAETYYRCLCLLFKLLTLLKLSLLLIRFRPLSDAPLPVPRPLASPATAPRPQTAPGKGLVRPAPRGPLLLRLPCVTSRLVSGLPGKALRPPRLVCFIILPFSSEKYVCFILQCISCNLWRNEVW